MLRIPSRIIAICFIFFASAAFTTNAGWTTGYPNYVMLRGYKVASGTELLMPVTVRNPIGHGITSYKFHVAYDPAFVQFASPPFEAARTFSEGMDGIFANTNYPGHLIITAYNDVPITGNGTDGSGTLLNLKFRTVGPPGQSTLLKFENWTSPAGEFHVGFMYNDGNPPIENLGYGRITISSNSLPVTLPAVNAAPGSDITIPITVGDLTGYSIIAYDLQVTFDSAVLQPASQPIDSVGTMSSNMGFTPNTANAGHLIVSAFTGGQALAGSGILVNLRFTIVGTPGQSSPLIFEHYQTPDNGDPHPGFLLNDGEPGSMTTNGSVTVGGASISGTVTYGNAIGAPSTRYVPNVLINGVGATSVSATTGMLDGRYLLAGFDAGSYAVMLSKNGGSAISSYDAGLISQHVVGQPSPQLSGNKLIVADVSGNGLVSSFDAGQIADYVAGGSNFGSTGNWIFNPVNRVYPSVTANIANEDYAGLLMGEVSGDWANDTSRSGSSRGRSRRATVELPQTAAPVGKEIVVPVNVQSIANDGVISYEFDLTYDPHVIQPQAVAADLTGTISRGLTVVTNVIEPGLLRVVVYGAMPISDDGVLLNLRFTAVGKSGSTSPLLFERIMFNEGEPQVNATDGQVELF
ncbi:MAG: hypothetical protein IPL32_01320 [Chloracidobacterium sp.]|nr:hypothetical protein [Chloracidobacterium sp.]